MVLAGLRVVIASRWMFLEIFFGITEIKLRFGYEHFQKINWQSPFPLMSNDELGLG
jgi:hypothetical protein